jgi:hypothetical protein
MNTSITQAVLVILFQLNFRLIAEPFNLSIKVFLYILMDTCMLMIIAFEWFKVESDWQFWIYEVCGETKKRQT